MGEIRFAGTGERCGYPYLVCKKKDFLDIDETCGYLCLLCKKRIVGTVENGWISLSGPSCSKHC